MTDITPGDRRMLIEMVRVWRGSHHDLRFGQWVWNVVGGDPFNTEDGEMAERMERWFEENGIEVDGKPQGDIGLNIWRR